MDILNMQNVSVGYDSKVVLDNFSLSVKKGEFLSIIGANGVGKSTLVKVLSGELKHTKGTILLKDRLLGDYSHIEKAKEFSFVSQFHDMQMAFTVDEFVKMARFPHEGIFHITTDQDIEIIEEAISLSGIEKYRHQKMNELSGGELQLVYIAHAIAQSKDFIILDEPVNHLDIANSILVMKLLKKLNSQGATIIAVMHDVNLASNWSTRLLGIKSGSVIFDGLVSDVLTELNLNKLYDINCRVHNLGGYFNIVPYINGDG